MISQLNATYQPEEDRVVFRFNTINNSEFRMWFTRALVHKLILACSEVAIKSELLVNKNTNAKEISEFKQEMSRSATQFTEFNTSSEFPLGQNPILVKRVNFAIENKIFVLAFDLIIGQTITLRLDEDLFSKFRLLMDAIEDKAGWGLKTRQLGISNAPDDPSEMAIDKDVTKRLH